MSRVAVTLLALLASSVLLGCGRKEAKPEAPTLHTYELRGVVSRLPDPADTQIWIHHEAMPDFVDIFGEISGMEAMTMPFTPAPNLSLEGIEMGSKVSFRLEVDWQSAVPARITAIAVLPADTQLDFEPPDPLDDDTATE